MATHSNALAWKIPWTEEPGRLQSMWSLRVRHDWATSLSLFTFMHWRRKWQPTPVFLPGESQGWRNLVGYSPWVAQNWTRLSDFTSFISLTSYFITGEGNGNPLQYSCLENPMDRGAWWAMVHGVAESQTRLRWLSTHAHKTRQTGLNGNWDVWTMWRVW